MVASFGAPDSEEFPTQKRNAITTQMTDALPTEIGQEARSTTHRPTLLSVSYEL